MGSGGVQCYLILVGAALTRTIKMRVTLANLLGSCRALEPAAFGT